MCDDLFDDLEKGDELLERSWKKTIGDINTEGYREGVDSGREESVQEGFNEAFSLATTLLFQVAKLRGKISGHLSANLLKPGTLEKHTESQLQDLLQDVCLYESELLTFSDVRFADLKKSSAFKEQSKIRVTGFNECEENTGELHDICNSDISGYGDIHRDSDQSDRKLERLDLHNTKEIGKSNNKMSDGKTFTTGEELLIAEGTTAGEGAVNTCTLADGTMSCVSGLTKLTAFTDKYTLILKGSNPV